MSIMNEIDPNCSSQEPETMGDEPDNLPETGIYTISITSELFRQLADPDEHQHMTMPQKYEQFPPLE